MLKDLMLFINNYGKDKKSFIILFLLASIFVGFLDFIGIGLIYPFFIILINPNSFICSKYYTILSKYFIFSDIQKVALFIGIFIVLIMLFKNVIMILYTYFQNKFIINWKTDLNKMLMTYYLTVPYKKILETQTSEKVYNLSVLVSQSLEIFVLRFLTLITHVIITLSILFLLYLKFKMVAIVSICFVLLIMYMLNSFFKNKTKILAPKMLEYSRKNNNQILETLNNLKEIRIGACENYFLNKFEEIQKQNNEIIFKNAFYANIPQYIVSILLILTTVILAIAIIYQNYGDLSKIIASYSLIVAIIRKIAPALNKLQVSLNHINTTKDIVKKANSEYSKNKFDKVFVNNTKANDIEFNNKISLENINFSYDEDRQIIKNISLEIKKGEFVGIIGLSGAGKSTLVDIILGLLPVDSGKIFIDNTEITEKNVFALRRKTGYVPQELNYTNETYKRNIAFGENESNIEDNKVIESLKEAQLYETIEEKGGINSEIKGLSQGQKQRLLIARALYKKPEIIIFDEATSSLDVKVEHEITQMLKNLKGKKTIIAIAHRLSTLKECDRLIYLKEGTLVDVGTFESLSLKYPEFKYLVKLSQI